MKNAESGVMVKIMAPLFIKIRLQSRTWYGEAQTYKSESEVKRWPG